MRKLAVVLGLAVLAVNAPAEVAPTWSKRFPSAQAIGAIAPRQGGFYVTLNVSSGQCIATIDANGGPGTEQCFDAVPTNIVSRSGASFLFGLENQQLWAAKFDATFKRVWARTVQLPEPVIIYGGDATSDGGLVLVGGYGETCKPGCPLSRTSCVVKFGADGTLQWFRVLDVTSWELMGSVRQVSDGYVVAGVGENGIQITKLDRSGSQRWTDWLYDGAGIPAVDVLPGGDIIVGGDAVTDGTNPFGFLVARIAADGRLLWQKRASVQNADFKQLIVRPDGAIVLYGRGFIRGIWATHLITLSQAGEVVWHRTLLNGQDFFPEGIQVTDDSGVVIAMVHQNVPELYKISRAGDVPAAIAPITIPGEASFEMFRSRPANPAIETSTISAKAVDVPLTPRAETLIIAEALPANRATTSGAPVATTASQQNSIDAAQREKSDEDQLMKRVTALLTARNFAELERVGREFRDTRAEFPTGQRKLALMYTAVSLPALEYGTEQQHIALVEEWRKAYPASPTAAVAAAKTYFEYAFAARGTSTSDAVTDAAWKKYSDLLARAHGILANAQPFAESDPGYQNVRIQVEGVSCNGIEGLVRDPHFAEQSDVTMWRNAAHYLLPRWCGDTDVYRKFAEYAASSTRKSYGDGLYALIAYDAVKIEEDRPVIATYKFEWPRIRQGLLDLIQRYPTNPYHPHRLAFLAHFFDDRATAKSVFEKPTLVWSSFAAEIWPGQYVYDQARSWSAVKPAPDVVSSDSKAPRTASASALRKPPETSTSWIAAGAANWPALFLVNDIRLQDGTAHKSQSFLVQTKSGVVAVSALTNFGTPFERPAVGDIPPARMMMPIAFDSFRAKLASWTLVAPQKPAQKFTVARIDPKTGGHGVVLTLGPARGSLPVKVLAPHSASDSAPYNARLFVVACRPETDPCVQAAFPGTYSGGSKGNVTMLSLVLDDTVDWEVLVGSPVIDENGAVFGVATGPSGHFSNRDKPGTVRIDVEEINDLLARAGV